MKVGDIYSMSWGYEQTNNTFYRIKALRGKTQAIIQEIKLAVKSVENSTGMSADYEYDTSDYELVKNSVFVKDNEKGRIVKIREERYGDPDDKTTGFYIGYHFCSPYKGERMYESWYC